MDARLEAGVLRLPPGMREGFLLYVRHGVRPGHFLLAILSNDLAEACKRADPDNQRALYDYFYVLHNYTPSECWGQPSAVNAWITKGQELRREHTSESAL